MKIQNQWILVAKGTSVYGKVKTWKMNLELEREKVQDRPYDEWGRESTRKEKRLTGSADYPAGGGPHMAASK